MPAASAPTAILPDEQNHIFAWAQGEAAKNAGRRAAHAPEPFRSLTDRIATVVNGDPMRIAPAVDPSEERERRQAVERCYENNGMPPRYRFAKFDGFGTLPAEVRGKYFAASQDVRSLEHNPGGIIVLLGPRGTGKTFLACALVNAFCGQRRHAVYAEAMDYFLKLDAEINARGSVLKIEAQYLRPELLVLDAMEERADTPAKDRMLTRLINKRYAAGVATVLITNETQEQFVARVGASVADRIRDDGQTVVCDWRSLRGRIGEGV